MKTNKPANRIAHQISLLMFPLLKRRTGITFIFGVEKDAAIKTEKEDQECDEDKCFFQVQSALVEQKLFPLKYYFFNISVFSPAFFYRDRARSVF